MGDVDLQPAESFEEINARAAMASYRRLGFFLTDKRPQLAAKEISMLLRRLTAAYGPLVFTELGREVIEFERERRGFCVLCEGSPRRAAAGEPFCVECRTGADAINAHYDAEGETV